MVVILLSLAGGIAVTALANSLWPSRRPIPAAGERRSGPQGWRDLMTSAAYRLGHPTGRPGRTPMVAAVLASMAATPSVQRMGRWAGSRGVTLSADDSDLHVTGLDRDTILAAKILCAAAATLLSLVMGVALIGAADLAVPVWIALAVTAIVGIGAYLVPDVLLRRQACRRREDFAQALPVWCDLVALEMAGSAAPEEALVTAAETGSTWPMMVLRDTLHLAVRSRTSHWQALTALGDRTGIKDLAELGRLSDLVSHEGAQVRDTFIERAASMRRRALAGALGQAGQRDESMRLAVLVIAAGIVLLMLFPGVVAVMSL